MFDVLTSVPQRIPTTKARKVKMGPEGGLLSWNGSNASGQECSSRSSGRDSVVMALKRPILSLRLRWRSQMVVYKEADRCLHEDTYCWFASLGPLCLLFIRHRTCLFRVEASPCSTIVFLLRVALLNKLFIHTASMGWPNNRQTVQLKQTPAKRP